MKKAQFDKITWIIFGLIILVAIIVGMYYIQANNNEGIDIALEYVTSTADKV